MGMGKPCEVIQEGQWLLVCKEVCGLQGRVCTCIGLHGILEAGPCGIAADSKAADLLACSLNPCLPIRLLKKLILHTLYNLH